MDTYGGIWYMKRVKHVIQPNWINSDILNAIKQRKYFHKKKDSGNFNLWRQTVRKLIYKAKTHYFNTHINENKRNPEQLWNSLRELSGTSVSSNIPHLNDAEGNLITSSSKTVDMFNTHVYYSSGLSSVYIKATETS